MQSCLRTGLLASTFAPYSLFSIQQTQSSWLKHKSPGHATPLASPLRVKAKVLPEAYKVNVASLPTPTSLWACILLLAPHLHYSRHFFAVLKTGKHMSPPPCPVQGLYVPCSLGLKCSLPDIHTDAPLLLIFYCNILFISIKHCLSSVLLKYVCSKCLLVCSTMPGT